MQTVKLPERIFTKNPAELVLRRDKALKTEGGYARARLQFDGADLPAAAEVLNIMWGDVSLTFTFGTADGINPLLLDAYVSGPSTYMGTLAAQLKKHPVLNDAFIVRLLPFDTGATDFYIEFAARERGSFYTLAFDIGGATTITVVSLGPVAGVDDVYYSPNEISLRVIDLHDKQELERMKAVPAIVEDSNEEEVSFHELPEILGSHVPAAFPSTYDVDEFGKSFATLQMELYEKRDDTYSLLVSQALNGFSTSKLKVLRGGFGVRNFDTAAAWGQFVVNGSSKKRFHTWQQRSKLVTAEQPEWLSVILPGNSYKKRFVIYFTDGSNTTKLTDVEMPGSTITGEGAEEEMMHFATGCDQNQLATEDPGKTIKYWEFTLLSAASAVLTETFTYIIDTRYRRHNRYFLFFNSLGAIDTLRCTGLREFSQRISRATTENVLTSGSRSRDAAIEMVYNEREEQYVFRTGWLGTKEEIDYLSELLQSELVAEAVVPFQPRTGGVLNTTLMHLDKLVVTADKVRMREDDQFGYALEWAAVPAWRESVWSNQARTDEGYYDGVAEFIVNVTAVTGTPTLDIVESDSDLFSIEHNGVVVSTAGANITMTKGVHHIKIRMHGTTLLSLGLTDCTADIKITEFDSRTVANFLCIATGVFSMAAFSKLKPFRFLVEMQLGGSNNVVDDLLVYLSRLYKQYEVLSNVVLDEFAFTPGTIGVDAGAYLTGEGVSVSTS
jgi:hypothetical protein